MSARFTLRYSLIVLAVTGALAAWMWYLVIGGLDWTHSAVKMVALSPLMIAVFATQLWDLIRPQAILTLTKSGLHDRRLTHGPILWHQIARILVYRKGWQYVALLEPVATTTPGRDIGLGPMPLYAFNRLCARLLKRPELVVGLGGMTVTSEALLTFMGEQIQAKLVVAA